MERESAESAAHHRSRPVAAAVLAGGRGSRMGGEKADLMLAGKPLAWYALSALGRAGLDPFVVTKSDRPVGIDGVEVVLEAPQPQHPLAGIAAAIKAAGDRQVIVVACDLPLLPAAYFAWLAGLEGGSVVPAPGGDIQPLAARYSPGDLGVIEAALEESVPARAAVERLDPVLLSDEQLRRFGDPARTFFNVNSPADLSQAEAMLAGP